jgi:hypothetical protein
MAEPQTLDSACGKVDHASEFGCELGRTILAEAALCLLGGKPSGIPIGLLRRFKAQDLTEMGADAALVPRRFRSPCVCALPPNVLGERCFLDPAMNSRLFESFEGSGLSVCQTRLGAALGESPMSAVGPNQQEFDAAGADPVADGGDLFAFPQFAKLRQWKELGWRLMRLC